MRENMRAEYCRVDSCFGPLWLHHCAALNDGPDWVRRERLVIDAGATDSQLTFRGRSMPFHGHLFKETDGQFRFTDRDKLAYPTELLDELENIVNRALI
jgi:hypothetical protein